MNNFNLATQTFGTTIGEYYNDTNDIDIVYDFQDEDAGWLASDSLRIVKTGLLPWATDSQQLLLMAEINSIEAEMAEAVRRVLSTIDSTDEAIEHTWLARAHPGIIDISELLAFWYLHDNDKIDSLAGAPATDDAEVFLEAVEFLRNCAARNIPVDSLPSAELDTLTGLAIVSYGDYTNIIRDYLNIAYDIQLHWPITELPPPAPKYGSTTQIAESHHASGSYAFSIRPNPTGGCFAIVPVNETSRLVALLITDVKGAIVYSGVTGTGDTVCLPDLLKGIYFLRIVSRDGGDTETHRLIIH